MGPIEKRAIDWPSAEVHDGRLTVQLTGQAPKGWVRHFQAVLELLDTQGSRWGEITVRKRELEVADVQEGAESDLRHLLESGLLQVNADLAPGAEPAAPPSEADPTAEADRRIGDAFRDLDEARTA